MCRAQEHSGPGQNPFFNRFFFVLENAYFSLRFFGVVCNPLTVMASAECDSDVPGFGPFWDIQGKRTPEFKKKMVYVVFGSELKSSCRFF